MTCRAVVWTQLGRGVSGYPEVLLNVGALNFVNSCKNQSGFDNW